MSCDDTEKVTHGSNQDDLSSGDRNVGARTHGHTDVSLAVIQTHWDRGRV